MIDLNRKPAKQQPEEVSPAMIIGTVIVIGAWMLWAFVIGGLL